jgi:Flp pilus assembly protein TadG
MTGRKSSRLRARRASVSVEFALVSLFFLFPLIAGGIDMMLVLSARSKLNSALHSLYLFAWSDPQNADDTAQLQRFIQSIDPSLPVSGISLTNTPTIMNVCFGSNGNIDSNATFTLGQSGNGGLLGSGGPNTNNDTCVTDGQVVTGDVPVSIATYRLQSVVQLPIPVPFLANPITLTASGTIQVQ